MAISQEQLLKSGLIKESKSTASEETAPGTLKEPPLTLESIQSILTKQRELPQEKRDYVYTYFLLEQFALQQNTKLTKENIRNDIKTKFNSAWFSPKVRSLFTLADPDLLLFTELILESVLKTLLKPVGAATLQRYLTELTKDKLGMNIIISKGQIDLRNLEKNIYADETHLLESQKAIHDIIEGLSTLTRNNLGASATEKLFSEAFQQLNSKFFSNPEFQAAVKALPEGLMDRERLNLLTKEELENVSRRLQQVDTMKSEFTNIVAHELKTPLVPMIGYTEMMMQNPERYGLNNKGLDYIKIFSRNSIRLKNLVDDILDVSKLEAGEMKFDLKEVVLAKTINEVITDLQPLAEAKNITLKAILPPKDRRPTITADTKRFGQVISNLLTNAIKFTDKGSVTLQVIVKNKFLNLSVTDTGAGLAKQDVKKIFEKFYQAQQASTRKTKGTGLGLAIAKKIVEAHGGKIWVTSPGKGKGSTFHVRLPIKKIV